MFKRFNTKAPLLLFLAIIAIASFLRLYKLDSVPPGVNRDEASIGFTAYSLLQTGRDEYGRLLPLSFQSFGDWKLPLYIYLSVPMVKIFGLTEAAVRITSAIAGIMIVALTFFLVKLLFKSVPLALIAMAVTAIAPWSLHLSRVESESNLAVFLTTLGVLLFFKADKQRPWQYLISFILWGLTYFAYAGNHIFTTLLVFGILILFRQTIFSNKFTKIGLAIFILLASVILSQTLIGADKTKISGISIFSSPFVVYQKIELPRFDHANPNGLVTRFFHNRVIYAFETVIQNYEKAFSPEFLAISGGTNHAHNIQNFGNIYLIEYPLLILGFSYLLTLLKDQKNKLILWWFLISPVAASITNDAPHTNRMFAVFPILPLIIALGIYWLFTQFRSRKPIIIVLVCILASAYLINLSIYLDRYYVHFPKNESQYWGLPYKEITKILASGKNLDKRVIMSRPGESPYIFILFYSRYDPAAYQRQAMRYPPTTDGFYDVRSFGRFEFRPINWVTDINLSNNILIDNLSDIPAANKNQVREIGNFGVWVAK